VSCAVEALAVVGNLALDRVAGSRARIGGGPYHAGRALRLLGRRQTQLVARCGEADRRLLLPRFAALGIPVRLLHGTATTAFSFSYDGDRREMRIDTIGDSWHPADVTLDRRVRWVHVAPLLRSDFGAEALASLARGRRLLLDGQGLVRRPQEGPIELDGDFDHALLEHVSILKLADEEAQAVGDPEKLGVPELLLTHGSRGATVQAGGRTFEVPAHAYGKNATGAGDAFSAVYLASRADGLGPASAARRATTVVAAVLR
jgi:sugar/nucleoside kinase (ribokinase family)